MKEKIVLIGSGQHARVVIYNIKAQGKYEIACMLDSDKNKIGREYEGYLIEGTYEEAQRVKEKYKTNKFFIAFGNMKYRKKVNYYTMGESPRKTAFVAGYRQGMFVPEYMQRFIELISEQGKEYIFS